MKVLYKTADGAEFSNQAQAASYARANKVKLEYVGPTDKKGQATENGIELPEPQVKDGASEEVVEKRIEDMTKAELVALGAEMGIEFPKKAKVGEMRETILEAIDAGEENPPEENEEENEEETPKEEEAPKEEEGKEEEGKEEEGKEEETPKEDEEAQK